MHMVSVAKVAGHTRVLGNNLENSPSKKRCEKVWGLGFHFLQTPKSYVSMDLIQKHTLLIPKINLALCPHTHGEIELTEEEDGASVITSKSSAAEIEAQVILQHLQDDFHGSAIEQWHNLTTTKRTLLPHQRRAAPSADYLATQV